MIKLSSRIPVKTSVGTYFVRSVSAADLLSLSESFEEPLANSNAHFQTLGEQLIKVLVCVEKNTDKRPALTDEMYSILTQDDLKALAEAVAKANHVDLLANVDPVESMGEAMQKLMLATSKQLNEKSDAVKKILASNFRSVSEDVKAALGKNYAEIAALQAKLKMPFPSEAIKKLQEDGARLNDFVKMNFKLESANSVLLKEALKNNFFGGDKWINQIAGNDDAIKKYIKAIGPIEVTSESRATNFSANSKSSEYYSRVAYTPRVEETLMSRAAKAGEDSVLHLAEVAESVAQMTERLGEMHRLFHFEVIPQWQKNIEQAGNQTRISIDLARWSINISIGVTVLATLAQIGVAHYYRIEDERQQNESISVIRQQLDATIDLNNQLTMNARQLQDQLNTLSKSRSTPAASREPSRPRASSSAVLP